MAGGSNRNSGDDGLAAMRAAEPLPAPDMTGEEGEEKDGRQPMLTRGPDGITLPCPVTPLGFDGLKLVLLDRSNQIVTTTTKCDKGDLMLLFGNGWLEGFAPQWRKGANKEVEAPESFDQRKVQVALVEDCHAKGIFNPVDRVFGRGAHRGPNSGRELVLHMGAHVLIADPVQKRASDRLRMAAAGAVEIADETLYYPARPSLPRPADKLATAETVRKLLDTFKSFYWVEEEGAPLLLLGMAAQMFICGALPWRSHMWLTAPTGTGKTTVQTILRELLGSWCLHTEDASEAAIRQVLGDDTLPVLIDEAEAHDKPQRLEAVLNLMKKASSGAKIHRGGADHKASEFTAQSCFLLSSVLHAPLRGEDRNRLAILEMRKIPQDAPPLELELAMWRTEGRRMHRRMIEHWGRWSATYSAYKQAIGALGYDGRAQDTYGTLLACADLLMFDGGHDQITPHDEPGRERIVQHVAMVQPLMERGRSEARSDVERVVLHLQTSMLQGANGNPSEPVGVWIDRAMQYVAGEFATDPPKINEKARDKLKAHGLRVVSLTQTPHQKQPRVSDPAGEAWSTSYLAIAHQTNQPLLELFRGSDWAGGAWVQSLGKIPGVHKAKIRFAGSLDNAICVPLSVFRADEEGEE